jgi:hypothetical protein
VWREDLPATVEAGRRQCQSRTGAKDTARSEAIRRWPTKAALFARVKDDGKAKAALIAVARLRRESAPTSPWRRRKNGKGSPAKTIA